MEKSSVSLREPFLAKTKIQEQQQYGTYVVFDGLDFVWVLSADVLVNKLLASKWLCADLAAPLSRLILLCLALQKLERSPNELNY